MTPSGPPPALFDRALLARRQARARKLFADHDFLHRRIAADLVDRLETVTRGFDHAAITGPGARLVADALTPACGVREVSVHDPLGDDCGADEEENDFPHTEQSLDLYVSIMSLHKVNDLPGVLSRIRRSLKPDGLFIAAMLGEETLAGLRQSLYAAETALKGGVSPRVSPFAAIKDAGGLLQRAGFALPVADIETVTVTYREPMRLFADLRGMAETNILTNATKTALRRDLLASALAHYAENNGDKEGLGVTARFDIIYLTGWSPHPDQQRPLPPGSGKASLADAIRSTD